MWEDESNKNGGRWQILYSKGFEDKIWEDLLLAFIGNQFDVPTKFITGIILTTRDIGGTIQIWFRDAT